MTQDDHEQTSKFEKLCHSLVQTNCRWLLSSTVWRTEDSQQRRQRIVRNREEPVPLASVIHSLNERMRVSCQTSYNCTIAYICPIFFIQGYIVEKGAPKMDYRKMQDQLFPNARRWKMQDLWSSIFRSCIFRLLFCFGLPFPVLHFLSTS